MEITGLSMVHLASFDFWKAPLFPQVGDHKSSYLLS